MPREQLCGGVTDKVGAMVDWFAQVSAQKEGAFWTM
jgi:hypothetical protein